LARRREADRAETLDPAVGVEQAAQQVESILSARIEIGAWDEFLGILQSPKAELLDGARQRIRRHAARLAHMAAVALHDAPVDATGVSEFGRLRDARLQPLAHCGDSRRKANRRSGRVSVADQRTQDP